MARMRELVERARAGRLRSSELTEPTITVTNLGDQGADSVLGVIYPPQVAILGFGALCERPWRSTARSPCAPWSRHPRRRPPRQRRHRGGPPARRDRPPAAGARNPMTGAELRQTALKTLGGIAPEADLSARPPTRTCVRRWTSIRWTS